MAAGRFPYWSRTALVPLVLAAPIALSALGCAVYTDLEGLARPDGGAPPSDGRSPTSDTGRPNDGTAPPADASRGDAGMNADTPAIDSANDAGADAPVPPVDVTTRDTGSDTSVGVDVTVDTTVPPPLDATPEASIDRAIDTSIDRTVPPPPEAGLDVRGPDVIDAGGSPADADAGVPPPPDADSGPGPIDVRDSGPTCWGGTPSTNDEDNDGIVDECDNCPSIANNNQADIREVNAGGAADGVGDACDPRPTQGGDGLYLFDGLNFTTLPADWTNVGVGNWTASGGSVEPGSTAIGQELSRAFPSNLGNYLAETTFTFTGFEANGSSSLPFRVNGGDSWRCVVGSPNRIQGQFFLSKVTGGVGEDPVPQITTIPLPQVGDRYRVLAGAYSGNMYCMLGTGERQNRSDTSTTGVAGFRSTGSSARFEYLLVYRLGGTIP